MILTFATASAVAGIMNQETTTLDRLKAYRALLKARGKLKEAAAVQRCIEIVKLNAKD